VGSSLGVSDEKILALADYAASPLYSEAERIALEYADAITITNRDVGDELFSRLRQFYDDDEIVELIQIITDWSLVREPSQEEEITVGIL
jgi:alkylhydroperoxidase family enzyme